MRALGIDYGDRRIGLAVSDASGTLARPLETVAGSRSPDTAAAAVLRVLQAFEADDERIDLFVVGVPTRLDGSASDQAPKVLAFVQALERRVSGRPIVMQDERLTSHEADQLLAVRERDWRVRKARLDAAAAAVILQEYLDAHPQARSLGATDDEDADA